MAMVIYLKPEKANEYKKLHAEAWKEVLDRIHESNIRNYSIFLKEPENILFGYWEYTGNDFDADMRAMADDPNTQEWWKICMPCQEPFETREEGEWWSMMEEVFHTD